MKKQNTPNFEYLFNNTIDVKDCYDRILSGERDDILFKNIVGNYVKPETIILSSHDRIESIKASQNVEFHKPSGKYYAKTYGYVYYTTNKAVDILPIINLSERWRGVLVFVYNNDMIPFENLEDLIDKMEIKLQVDIDGIANLYKKMRAREIYGEAFSFVEGIKPIDGSVAKVILDIEMELIPGLKNIDGSINFKERNFIHNVSEGEKIAHYSPAIESKNGIDIYEEPIEAAFDSEENYILGENVSIAENGTDIISTTNGIVLIENKTLSVDNTLELSRIDLVTGNIDINGTLLIKEDVEPGFKIISEHDIIIHGSVEDCLISSKGNLVVSSAILGSETSDIHVNGDIHASFIRNARIFASGDVTVVNQIINSNIISNGRVVVVEGKGVIIGGTVSAKKGVFAKIVGSATDAATTIIAGQDIENETRYRKILDGIKERQAEIARIKTLLGNEYLRNAQSFLDKLNTAKKLEAYNFMDKIEILTNELKNMEQEKKAIYSLFENITDSVISIEKAIFPGVIIQIGVNKRVITQQITGTEFSYHESSKSIYVKSPKKLTDKEYKKIDYYLKDFKKTERKKEAPNKNVADDNIKQDTNDLESSDN